MNPLLQANLVLRFALGIEALVFGAAVAGLVAIARASLGLLLGLSAVTNRAVTLVCKS